MANWNDKICVITGAASGIGAGLAKHAAGLGMQVVAADVDSDNLESLAHEVDAAGGRLSTQRVDVRSEDQVAELARQAFDDHGVVHLFFNNAGVLVDGKSWERSTADWRWNLEVNVMGVVNGIRSFVPRMLEQNAPGRIINTSSVGGLLGGGSYLAPYQASKHAIAAISETLFQELAQEPADVSVSCLCPGEVATGIWQSQRLLEAEQRYSLDSDDEQDFHDHVAAMVDAGLTPEQFAARVFDGIEQQRFWILPQPEFKALLQQRVDSIMNETDPLSTAAAMALLTGSA